MMHNDRLKAHTRTYIYLSGKVLASEFVCECSLVTKIVIDLDLANKILLISHFRRFHANSWRSDPFRQWLCVHIHCERVADGSCPV